VAQDQRPPVAAAAALLHGSAAWTR
jgi:hypothetical protein